MGKTAVKHPGKSVSTERILQEFSCEGWLYVSGHASQDMKTRAVISGTTAEETRRTMEFLGMVLQETGCTVEDVVKCTCYLANPRAYGLSIVVAH